MFLGMDPDAANRVAQTIDTEAEMWFHYFDQIEDEINDLQWTGDDSQRFREKFTSIKWGKWWETSADLRKLAEELRGDAREQVRTSEHR